MALIPALQQNYQYGQYGQGGNIPFGGLTVQPRITPTPSVDNQYGISIPQNHSYTTDETGAKVSMGQDGVGLAHRDPGEYKLHLIG